MTNRHSNDPSRFNRVEADLLLNGEQRTGPIAALMNAAAGPGSVREQTGEFVALTAFRAAEAATEPVPVARSGRHAAPATPFRLGLVLAAGLSRLLSPRILVGAIGVAAAVGVVVAMYAGSLGQPGRPDTASAPAMPAPAEAPVKDQVLPPAGVPACRHLRRRRRSSPRHRQRSPSRPRRRPQEGRPVARQPGPGRRGRRRPCHPARAAPDPQAASRTPVPALAARNPTRPAPARERAARTARRAVDPAGARWSRSTSSA